MSDASDIFEKLLLMMLMNDIVSEELPIITVNEAEISKAEKMYEKKESN